MATKRTGSTMNHAARAKRRMLMAKHAAKHGASSAAIRFGVARNTILQAAMENGLTVAKEPVRPPNKMSCYRILKMLLDEYVECNS